MHPAPAASHPVGAWPVRWAAVAALSVAGVAALLAWWASGAASGPALAVAAGIWLAAQVWALAGVRSASTGRLVWDGARWQFDGSLAAAADPTPEIVLDLQTVMLLKWPADRPIWLWVARSDDPASWAGLRRALRAAVPDASDVHDAGGPRPSEPGRRPT